MNSIFKMQQELQDVIIKNRQCASTLPHSKGSMVNHIKDHAFYMSEEVTELMIAVGGDRAILKPWSVRHKDIVNLPFETSDDIKSEAIDMLCFCINICLAVGITPYNINDEYGKVWLKNMERQHNDY